MKKARKCLRKRSISLTRHHLIPPSIFLRSFRYLSSAGVFILNIRFIYHVLIKAKLILMPLTHINLFSFVHSGVGAIAGDFFTYFPLRSAWLFPSFQREERLGFLFRLNVGRLIRIINHWGAFVDGTIVDGRKKTREGV